MKGFSQLHPFSILQYAETTVFLYMLVYETTAALKVYPVLWQTFYTRGFDRLIREEDMNSVFQIRDNCMTIRVPEELDHHNALPIQQEADEVMMNRNIQTIIFDFRDTSFMDSSGIGVLMGRYRAIQRKGGRIQAENVNERIEKILQMSGISKLIPVNRKKEWL